MEHPYSLRDIQKHTGLKYDFLRRIVKEIPELADAYAVKGLNNALMFNTNGLACFREVAQMKEAGYTLPSIRSQVLSALPKQSANLPNQSSEPQHNQGTQPGDNVLIRLLEAAHKSERESFHIALSEKEKMISQQQQTIQALESGLKLLTDGRSPEEVRQEQQKQANELFHMKALLQEQKTLLAELSSLRWYQGKRKKGLLKRLKSLVAEISPAG